MKHNDNLYNSVRQLIESAKSNIVRQINATIILTYYEIGRLIIKDQQKGKYRADYAKKDLEELSG